jgi:hypothetical protein
VVEFDASLQKNISHCHSLGYLLLSELRYVWYFDLFTFLF